MNWGIQGQGPELPELLSETLFVAGVWISQLDIPLPSHNSRMG